MAFIDPVEIETLKNLITSDLSQLGKIYKSKNNNYHIRSVDHNLVEGLLKEGWEEYGAPLKTKTRIRKEKTHSVKFEDDIWCQLYQLGYRCLNINNEFVLPYGKDSKEKKQIDVIAIDNDSILLVECRSSAKRVKCPSLKTEFEGLPRRLSGFKKALDQMFGKNQKKIKYIFATRNLRVDRNGVDIQRLEDTQSFYYNDNTYDYIQSLIKTYREAASYQVSALLFRGQVINKDKIEVPAIEGKMGDKTYYMFSIEPKLLLKMCFIMHRTRANETEMPTYQRLLVPSKLKAIGKYIEDGGFFPNSIIVNFGKSKSKLHFEPGVRGAWTDSRFGTLKIPNAYATAYIIDGQHRVFGYARSSKKDSNTIPVVAFRELDASEQLEIFMDINENQKAVSATLRITLEEDLYWGSDRADSRLKALRSSIIRELATSGEGPLYGKVALGEDRAYLTAKPFSTALNDSGLLPKARGNKYVPESTEFCLYDIGNHSHNTEMLRAKKRVTGLLNFCYSFVEEKYPEVFEDEKSFIISNRGTYAFICLIGSLIRYESAEGNLTIKSSHDERCRILEKYLKSLMTGIVSLEKKDSEELFTKLGTGGDVSWFRFFQSIIHKNHKAYNPIELKDWYERQDIELQEKGGRLAKGIERMMKKLIISNLKKLYSENWDLEIGSIQRECEKRAKEEMEKLYKEDFGRKEIVWTEMFFINDYKKIIEEHWGKRPESSSDNFVSFEEMFSIDVGMGFKSKKEKTKWISIFNSHRNNLAHEGTKDKGLNVEEVSFLERVSSHIELFHSK